MRRRLHALAAVVLLCLVVLLSAAPALAATDPYKGINCSSSGSGNSAICSQTAGNPVNTVLQDVTNIIAIVAGTAAVIVIIAAGIRFISAGSNAEEVAKARRAIIFAAIGLVVIVSGRTIIYLIIGGI